MSVTLESRVYEILPNGLEIMTVIDGKTIDVERITPCADIVDRCDVQYPHFPCWQLCGKSYMEYNGIISCKNYDLIKRLLEEK